MRCKVTRCKDICWSLRRTLGLVSSTIHIWTFQNGHIYTYDLNIYHEWNRDLTERSYRKLMFNKYQIRSIHLVVWRVWYVVALFNPYFRNYFSFLPNKIKSFQRHESHYLFLTSSFMFPTQDGENLCWCYTWHDTWHPLNQSPCHSYCLICSYRAAVPPWINH